MSETESRNNDGVEQERLRSIIRDKVRDWWLRPGFVFLGNSGEYAVVRGEKDIFSGCKDGDFKRENKRLSSTVLRDKPVIELMYQQSLPVAIKILRWKLPKVGLPEIVMITLKRPVGTDGWLERKLILRGDKGCYLRNRLSFPGSRTETNKWAAIAELEEFADVLEDAGMSHEDVMGLTI